VIGNGGLFISRSGQLGELTVRLTAYHDLLVREFAAAGGLMSYGGGIADPYRQFGVYTGRALKVKSQPTCRFSSPRQWS
jgi:hypothetical protein